MFRREFVRDWVQGPADGALIQSDAVLLESHISKTLNGLGWQVGFGKTEKSLTLSVIGIGQS